MGRFFLARLCHSLRVQPKHVQLRILGSALFLIVTALAAFLSFGVPHLQRLSLRLGLTLFDYGFYGFYPTCHYITLGKEGPDVEVALWDSRCSNQYTFLAPHGPAHVHDTPMIMDSRGHLVWMMDSPSETVQDFGVQEYQGEKYLTFWHGLNDDGHGRGYWSMVGKKRFAHHN